MSTVRLKKEWLEKARDVARTWCTQHGSVTADDVRTVWPPPEGLDPRVMGAVFSTWEFKCVGYEKSGRETCHFRPVGRFVLNLTKPGQKRSSWDKQGT